MIHEKITPEHLKRLALVYVRQSSPGQVRRHPESARVQKRLVSRARQLGWRESQIRVLDHDLGASATSPGKRAGFDEALELVKAGRVGIVFGVDASRLARNSVEGSLLVHFCALVGTLVADDANVWDPTLPQDSLVLGIQTALAAHESFAMRKRMDAARREKASRGELHHGVPPGYVCVEGKHLRKHPDRRVQQALERVFTEFEHAASIWELLRRLWKDDAKLPAATPRGDGQPVSWVDPDYDRVRDILENPKYAGIYAYPLRRVIVEVQPDGTVRKTTRTVLRGQWEVELRDAHPAYITVEQYERNQAKIAMNANRCAPQARGAPLRGESLLTGLIYCRRCDHQLGVRYPSSGAILYSCRRGRRQRDARDGGCFHFRANELEAQLVEQVLQATRPAGIAAAELASARLASHRRQRRQVLEDACQQAQYEADLTRRRLDHVDPANRLVFETLANELEQALQTLHDQQSKLEAFDREEPPQPTEKQRAQLLELGRQLETVWYSDKTDGRLKKQIVRTLIRHIFADLDESRNEVVLYVQWTGGQITELRQKRRASRTRSSPSQLVAVIGMLRKVVDDAGVARILNRSKLRTERGETWTKRRVSEFRQRHGIAAFNAREKEREGWLLQSEAATRVNISPMSVHRLIQQGILPAEHYPGLPSVIRSADLAEKRVQQAVLTIQSHENRPLPADPKQLSLFPTTKSQESAS